MGVELTDLGPLVDPVSLFPAMVPLPREEEGRIYGEVLWVDRYGNAQLNIDPEELTEFEEQVRLVFDNTSRTARRVPAFASVDRGEVGLIVDSYGLMAVVLDRASAAEEFGLKAGSAVTIEALDEDRQPGIITPVSISPRPV
jgi:hypothetical protein